WIGARSDHGSSGPSISTTGQGCAAGSSPRPSAGAGRRRAPSTSSERSTRSSPASVPTPRLPPAPLPPGVDHVDAGPIEHSLVRSVRGRPCSPRRRAPEGHNGRAAGWWTRRADGWWGEEPFAFKTFLDLSAWHSVGGGRQN